VGTGVSAFRQVRIGYRIPSQLGLLERFHGTLKQEEVYWNLYDDPRDAREKLERFKDRYNQARPHLALVAGDPTTVPARILTPTRFMSTDTRSTHRHGPGGLAGWKRTRNRRFYPPRKTLERISA
jgi:hypothetical protein